MVSIVAGRALRLCVAVVLGLRFFIACGDGEGGGHGGRGTPHGSMAGAAGARTPVSDAGMGGSGGASVGDGGPEEAGGGSGVVTTVIGPAGGEVVLDDMTLLFPAGALTAPEVIQVTARDADPGALPAEDLVIGKVYDFQPDGLTFQSPALLTIRRAGGAVGVNDDDLVIASSDAGSTEWTTLDSWLSDDRIGALVEHFSLKGLWMAIGKHRCAERCAPCEQCDPKTNSCKPWKSGTPLADCGTHRCFELSFDHDHCGACGHACGPDEICDAGSCTCKCQGPDGKCADLAPCHEDQVQNPRGCGCLCKDRQKTACGAVCTDTTSDDSNCGTCGNQCDSDQFCAKSTCICNGGYEDCDGDCTDTSTNHDNCGFCGRSCAADEVCVDSLCECPSGKSHCDGACIDLDQDSDNCGGCNHHCPEGRVCRDGACGCPEGTTECDGQCVNLVSDDSNCGACGNVCAAGQGCDGSACKCLDPEQENCGGTCKLVSSDSDNCGACGTVCAEGQSCVDSTCKCSDSLKDNCGGKCVDLKHDTANCGTCGNACAGGQSCIDGSCGTCPGNPDFMTDTRNCGFCGNKCPTSHIGQYACVGGSCTCTSGEYCNSVQGEGCCTNPSPYCNPCGDFTGFGCFQGGFICTSTPHSSTN